MKKIAFLISSAGTGGGIQKSVSMVSKGLNKQKYSITIISLFNFEKLKYDFGEGTLHIKGTLDGITDLKKDFFKAYLECKRLLESADFDTLVVEGLGLVPFIQRKYFKNHSSKVIVCDHTGLGNYSRFGLSWMGLKIAIKSSDEFIVLTKENKDEYSRMFNKYKSKIKVIPNALDPFVERSPYDSNSKKICYAGRLSYEKGVDLLIEAFANAIHSIQDEKWVLDIFGDGPQLDNINHQISHKNLENRVYLKGYKSNIFNFYNEYAFLVVPSRFESFGLIIIEALKAGIPVIAFDCNYGPRSLIRNGENGFLIPENNIGELSNAIKNLMLDDELRVSFSENTNRYLDKYEYPNILSEWEEIL